MEAQFYVFSPLFVFLSTRRLMHRVKEGVFRGYWLYWALLLVSILIRVILLAVYDWDLDKNSDITYPDSTLHVFVASLEFYTKVRISCHTFPGPASSLSCCCSSFPRHTHALGPTFLACFSRITIGTT